METNEKIEMEKLEAGKLPPDKTPIPEEPEVSSTICKDTGEPISKAAPEEIPTEPP